MSSCVLLYKEGKNTLVQSKSTEKRREFVAVGRVQVKKKWDIWNRRAHRQYQPAAEVMRVLLIT